MGGWDIGGDREFVGRLGEDGGVEGGGRVLGGVCREG